MAFRFPRAVMARVRPVRGLPRAHTSLPRRPIPLHVQSSAVFSTKPDPDPTVSLPAAAIQNRAAQQLALLGRREPAPHLVDSGLDPAYAIEEALELYRLSYWGFVLFRCTYRSQEKWEKFVALVQKHARDEFEEAGLLDVYSLMRWTVFEDAAALDGADVVETSRRFAEWVTWGPGWQEILDSVFGVAMARQTFFLHVDEESLESVVDDAKAREKDGYFVTVVRGENILLNALEMDRETGVFYSHEEGRELEEEEMWDMSKRVRIDGLVRLYAALERCPDLWYLLHSRDDYIFEST